MFNAILTLAGFVLVTKTDNTPAQQSIANAILGVGLFRSLNDIVPLNRV